MVPELRQAYNAAFTAERYEALQQDLDAQAGAHIDFRLSETPVFLSAELTARLVEASSDVLAAVRSESYLAASRRAIPPGREVPGEDAHPAFLQIDFALVRGPGGDNGGEIEPRLIELQGFPSLYGFQWALARAYRQHFAPGMSAAQGWTPYFVASEEEYVRRLRELIVGDCDPREVVLLEIDPARQKTRVDFACMEQMLGIPTVDARRVVARGGRLYYPGPGGVETPICRIYNRVIFDEMERKGLDRDLAPIFFQPHDVEWVGHPNWFARISKFTLPFLNSRYAPRAWFVSDLAELPEDLENYVLKPLFSFAGLGVELGPTAERLRGLDHPEHFILQRRVEYAGVIETPDVPAKAEVRMMYLWGPGAEPVLVNNLVRLSKGAMMGVDFNKNQTWIGASVAFHPPVVAKSLQEP